MTQVHDPVVIFMLVKTVLTHSLSKESMEFFLKKVGHDVFIRLNTVY